MSDRIKVLTGRELLLRLAEMQHRSSPDAPVRLDLPVLFFDGNEHWAITNVEFSTGDEDFDPADDETAPDHLILEGFPCIAETLAPGENDTWTGEENELR